MCVLLSCKSISFPFNFQDQLSTLRGLRCDFASETSFLPTVLNSASFFGLILQYAAMLSATIFKNSVTMGSVIQNENTFLPYDPALNILGPNESSAYICTETCTGMFRAALFITART